MFPLDSVSVLLEFKEQDVKKVSGNKKINVKPFFLYAFTRLSYTT